jgi:hypothetical protein
MHLASHWMGGKEGDWMLLGERKGGEVWRARGSRVALVLVGWEEGCRCVN